MKFGMHNSSWLIGPDPAEAFEAVKAKGSCRCSVRVKSRDFSKSTCRLQRTPSRRSTIGFSSPPTTHNGRLRRSAKAVLIFHPLLARIDSMITAGPKMIRCLTPNDAPAPVELDHLRIE
jgi:hypothetical protein